MSTYEIISNIQNYRGELESLCACKTEREGSGHQGYKIRSVDIGTDFSMDVTTSPASLSLFHD